MLLVQAESYRKQYNFNAIYLIPVNLFGPRDHFDVEDSHVIPALILKFFNAKKRGDKSVTVWGTGNPTREFLYVQDAAEGIILATEKYDKSDPVNLGLGFEVKIYDLVYLIKELAGFDGEVIWDETKPDGQPKRMLDVDKAKNEFGFVAKTGFEEGLKSTIKWYKGSL